MGLLQLRDSRLLTREARTGAEAQIIEKRELLTGLLLSMFVTACSPIHPGPPAQGCHCPQRTEQLPHINYQSRKCFMDRYTGQSDCGNPSVVAPPSHMTLVCTN